MKSVDKVRRCCAMNSENTVFSFQMKEMCVCMFRGSLVRGTLRMIRKFAGPIFLSSSLSPVYYNNPSFKFLGLDIRWEIRSYHCHDVPFLSQVSLKLVQTIVPWKNTGLVPSHSKYVSHYVTLLSSPFLFCLRGYLYWHILTFFAFFCYRRCDLYALQCSIDSIGNLKQPRLVEYDPQTGHLLNLKTFISDTLASQPGSNGSVPAWKFGYDHVTWSCLDLIACGPFMFEGDGLQRRACLLRNQETSDVSPSRFANQLGGVMDLK